MILSYIVQYSKLIQIKFKNILTFPNAMNISQYFQFAISGFILSSFKVMSYLEKHRFKTISLSLLFLYLVNEYDLFNATKKYYYSNLKYFFGTPPIFFVF